MASSAAFYQAYVELLPEARGFRKALSSEFNSASDEGGKRAGKGFNAGLLGGIGSLAGPLAGAVAALGIGKLFKDAVGNASDFAEAGTAVTAVFGSADKTIQDFAKNAATALGQSTNQTLDAARVFGTFGKAAGLGGENLADFSTEFITLAGDLASFNNTTPEQAIEALGAGLRGESEPLRAYGILLDDAALKARAVKLGIYSGTGALTQQQKVLASQAEIMAQTGIQQGDFAKTSGGLANQQRILSAQLANLSSSFGTLLLPVVLAVVGALNTKLVPALGTVVDSFKFVAGYISGEGANVDVGWLESPLTKVADFAISMRAAFEYLVGYISGAGSNVDIGWLEAPMAALGQIAITVGTLFSGLAPVFSGLLPAVIGFFTEFSPITMLLEAIAPVLPVVVEALSSLISTLGSSLGGGLVETFAALAPLLPSLIDAFVQLVPAISQLVVALIPVLVDVITQLLPPLVQLITNLLPAVVGLIVGLAAALEFAAPFLSFLATVLAGFIGLLGTPTQTALNSVADWFMSFGPIGEFFAGIIRNIGDLLKDGLGGAFTIVGDKIFGMITTLTSLGMTALAAVGDLGQTLFSAGKSLIDGFIGGITDSLGGVGDAIGGVLDFAAGFFPHSPAKRGPFSGSGWTAVKSAGLAIGDQFSAGLDSAQSRMDLSMSALVNPSTVAPRIDASVYGAGASTASAAAVAGITQYNTFDHLPPEVAVELAGQRLTSAARRARV
jgi:hypothetical protein